MCLGMRGIVLCKSHVVKRVLDDGGVINMGGKQNVREGRKKVYELQLV